MQLYNIISYKWLNNIFSLIFFPNINTIDDCIVHVIKLDMNKKKKKIELDLN